MKGTLKFSKCVAVIICLTIVMLGVQSQVSFAFGSGCNCGTISSYVNKAHSTTRSQVCDCYQSRMDEHESWILEEFWPLMEEALKGSASQQTQGQISGLQAQNLAIDADNHVDTRRERETQMVQTMRRYSGADHAVCTPASISQSRTASEELAKGAASNIARAMLKNAVGSTEGRSFNGPADDRAKRFATMTSTYCADNDYGGAGGSLGCTAPDETHNLDISFTEIFNGRDVNGDGKIDASDFFQGTVDQAEESGAWDAFKSNMGLQLPFENIDVDKISPANAGAYKSVLMAQRQYQARRSVAAASFIALEGLTQPAVDGATEYLRGLYSDMGRVPTKVIPDNPSAFQQQQATYHDYYADANTFIQEYTGSPENVQRHQAIALSTINSQLWDITQLLRRIDLHLANNTLSTLDDEYRNVQGSIQRLNGTR